MTIRGVLIIIVAVFMLALSFILLVVWNNAIYDPDGGLDSQLDEQAQKDMSNEFYQTYDEQQDNTRWHYGLTGVLIFAVIFAIIIIAALDRKKNPGQ